MENRRPDSRGSREPSREQPPNEHNDSTPTSRDRDSSEGRPQSAERREWRSEDPAIFSCRLCDSRFSSASLLSWHYHQCHTDKAKLPEHLSARSEYSRLPLAEDQSFPCVYCWQNFPSYQSLIGHISTAHASAWYQSLAAANRIDEYAYMRQYLHDRLDRSPLPIGSPLASVTSPLTTSPLLTSPLMTSPIISPPDVKPLMSPAAQLLQENRVSIVSPESDQNHPLYKDNRVTMTNTPSTSISGDSATNQRSDRVNHHDNSNHGDSSYTRITIDNNEQYLCRFCDLMFCSLAEVQDHVTASHVSDHSRASTSTSSTTGGEPVQKSSGGKYECQYCTDAFPLYTALQEHIRCYHGDEYYRRRGRKDSTPPLPPAAAQGQGPSKTRPVTKSTPPTTPDPPMFKCRLCVSGFTENSLLADHYQKIHGLGTSPPMPTAPVFPTMSSMPLMMPTLPTPPPPLPTPPQALPQPQPQPQPPAQPLQPQAPPKSPVVKSEPSTKPPTPSQDSRSSSNPSTEPTIELKYICEVCDARFPLYVSMQEHIRTAHGERPFECDVCRKQFTKRCYLLKHLQSHPNTHYDCLHCGRRFLSWTQRRDHMMQHEIEGVFLCTHCGSRFTLQRHLEQHLRTHADATHVLVCVDCNEKFEDSLEFQEHVRSHVRCPYCSQVFDTNKNLVEHIETTHQKAKLQARLQQEATKKPQKSVAPVPKTKVHSPAKPRIETITSSTIPTTSTITTSTMTSTLTTVPSTSSSASNPFTSSSAAAAAGIAPMYVWMPGSHFPAAVFPTLSIVSPQLTAMQALNENMNLLPDQTSNLMAGMAGYPAYALPYPYAGNLMVPPRGLRDGSRESSDPRASSALISRSEQRTDRPEHGDRSVVPTGVEPAPKRRRTPELDVVSVSASKRPKPSTSAARRTPPVSSHVGPTPRADDTRHRYGTLIDHLSIPPRHASVSLQCDMKEKSESVPMSGEAMNKFGDQFVCKVCAEILPTAELLARHEVEHAAEESKPLNLSTRSIKDEHDVVPVMVKNDPDEEPKRTDVIEHLRRKIDVQNRPTITKDMLMHCEITPVGSDFFRCEICMSIISNLHLVEKHLNEHFVAQQVEDESAITFTCGKCRVSFKQRSEFFYHLLKNHTDDNYYQCSICKKKFITERFLDKHMNVHLLAQNFNCQFCQKGFYLADVCNRHERLHLQYGDKPKPLPKDAVGMPITRKLLPSAAAGCPSSPSDAPLQSPSNEARYKHHMYAMYKCRSCQMEFSHKRQIKQHLKVSACALDDRTSTKHYTKFHKCKLCHLVFDELEPVLVSQHLMIRHQINVEAVSVNVEDLPSTAGPKSDSSTGADSSESYQDFYSAGYPDREKDWPGPGVARHEMSGGAAMFPIPVAQPVVADRDTWVKQMKTESVEETPGPQVGPVSEPIEVLESVPVAVPVSGPPAGPGHGPSVDCVCHICGMAFADTEHYEGHKCEGNSANKRGVTKTETNTEPTRETESQ